jgi:Transposase DDE domain group 1
VRFSAFWLMLAVRSAIPKSDPLARAEFATIRDRLLKIGAKMIDHVARIRIHLPTSCPEAWSAYGSQAQVDRAATARRSRARR